MKTKTNFWITLLFCVAIAMTGCEGEQGPMGPAGPQGAQGMQGVQGIAGAAGKDGGTFYSGAAAPAATLGKVGDMYLNTSTSQLFGPKTTSGWGTPLNLKGATGATGATGSTGATGATGPAGPTGATGAAGSMILSGTATPAATLGRVGDYYLDKDDFLLYGPKTSAGWGVGILLRGKDGNANVVTGIFTLTSADWLWNGSYTFQFLPTAWYIKSTRYCVKNFAPITSSILNTGAVLVYFTPHLRDNPNRWEPLPFNYLDTRFNEYYVNIVAATDVGKIQLHYFYTSNEKASLVPNLQNALLADYKFKVVVIASSSSTPIARLYPDIDFNNYEQVSKAFNLD